MNRKNKEQREEIKGKEKTKEGKVEVTMVYICLRELWKWFV